MDALTIILISIIVIVIIFVGAFYFFYIKPGDTKQSDKIKRSETDINVIIDFVNKVSNTVESEKVLRKAMESKFDTIDKRISRIEDDTYQNSLANKIKKLNNILYGSKDSQGKYVEPGLLWRLGMIFGSLDSNAVSDATDTYIFPDITGLQGKIIRVFKEGLQPYVTDMKTHYDTLKIATSDIKHVTFAVTTFTSPTYST